MSDWLPYGRHEIDEDDIQAVVEVLRSEFLTQGPKVPEFEREVAGFCRAAHGVAVSSCTAALHLALKAMGVGHGDRVWTSPITFVASANAARYCGAKPDFVDIDPATANMSCDALHAKLEVAERVGTLPKVVIPVHFAGQSCEMHRIRALADRYGFRILEDAAHALGGDYLGKKIGSCQWSDATTHSFHPVKIITTGEGGMVTTNDGELAWKIGVLRSHGITRDAERMVGISHGDWYYQQVEFGYHYRMTELQAALGISQMKKLASFATRRRELAACYDEALADFPLRPLARDENGTSGWHLYVVRVDIDRCRRTRREVFDHLRADNICAHVHYIPVHLQPDYARLGFVEGMFPEAERYYQECLTLPLFPGMNERDINRVVSSLKNALFAK